MALNTFDYLCTVMKKIIFLLCLITATAAQGQKPRLLVNIVVSQLRYDDARRWMKNLDPHGLQRFENEGASFDQAKFDYMQTTTPAGLATLTTGADPSTHGIVADHWVDYTTGARTNLIDDHSAHGLGCDAGRGAYSGQNITTPTLADRLRQVDPQSKVVTVAADPVSAVVMGGGTQQVYWLDEGRGCWSSSTAYTRELPQWVQTYNDKRTARQWLDYTWRPLKPQGDYLAEGYEQHEIGGFADMPASPVGTLLVAEFAKLAVASENLGADGHTDMLNICFDSPRLVAQKYGQASQEAEDCFYRLDVEIGNLLDYLHSVVNLNNVVVVITSDHGGCEAFVDKTFNAAQFKVIMSGFLNAQYGTGDWVVDYADRQLFLNRTLIHQKGLSVEEVQNRTAAFALQFRGVSHVLTGTAMQSSYFGGGYARMMQNGFYPRRGGDLTVNLMPGWVEEIDRVRADSGGMYDYDTHVPLWVMGARAGRVNRPVSMADLAPTLAQIMQIGRPIAAQGNVITELL